MASRVALVCAAALVVGAAAAACASTHGSPAPPADDDAGFVDTFDAEVRESSLPDPDAIVFADVAPPKDAGADAPSDACAKVSCAGKTDGFNWDPCDPNARCCGGQQVTATTNDNCGACGIACNAANGESCAPLGGRYFCRGCVASAGCWSKCCSTSFTPHSCAASDCAGNCSNTYCPPGTHCVVGLPNSSDYCAY